LEDTKLLPLLLLDDGSMMTALNEGEFKSYNLTFEETRHLLEIYDEKDILKGFNNPAIETIIFDYLGVAKRDFAHKHIRNMRPGQEAIVFKLYTAPSITKPIIHADGVEAKKIYNCYVYCQHIIRVK